MSHKYQPVATEEPEAYSYRAPGALLPPFTKEPPPPTAPPVPAKPTNAQLRRASIAMEAAESPAFFGAIVVGTPGVVAALHFAFAWWAEGMAYAVLAMVVGFAPLVMWLLRRRAFHRLLDASEAS